MNDSNKKRLILRYYLLGKSFNNAVKAFEYSKDLHVGKRKDGVTPEFDHQVDIALYIKTIHEQLLYPEDTFSAVFLHDTPEDKDIGFEEIDVLFGRQVMSAVKLLTKKHRGEKMPIDYYYKLIADDPIASVVKGADRMHNIQHMQSCFTKEKQLKYIEETEELVLPMLKTSKRTFVQQENIYENIKLILLSQIDLLKKINA